MENYSANESAPWSRKADQIKKVVVEAGVTSIGDYAFARCTNLTSVTIPDSVTTIGYFAFSRCSSLTSVAIPDSVTSIERYAFSYCSSLTSVAIPESVTRLEYGVFDECSSLTSVTIPESVTTIEGDAFSGCSSLTSVTIPEGVTTIAWGVFYGCSSLTGVTIPEGVTSIEGNAFSYCSSLTSVTIPESVTSIGVDAFRGCSSLTGITIPEGVTTLGEYAFCDCSSLTSVTIPEGVTTIGDSTFSGCSRLTGVTIPDSVTTIENSAFENCTNLTSVVIPDGVTSIKMRVFYNCSSLTSVAIPEGVTTIKNSAFYGCHSLTSVTIPDGVTTIEQGVFYNCSSLTNVTIPEGVTAIGDSAFNGCSSLTGVTIPKGVTTIGYAAFAECGSLTSVTIPDSVTTIEDSAFYGCSSLTSVTIPEGVTTIEWGAFSGCSSLTDVYYDGTKEQWNAISIYDENDFLEAAEIHCTDGDIAVTRYRLSGEIAENGSFAYKNGGRTTNYEVSAKKDTNVWYCVYADDGYVLKHLTVDEMAIPEAVNQTMYSGDYTMQEHDAAITAEFKPVRDDGCFTIEIGGDLRNGTVSVENDVVKAGETVTVTVEANPGYRLDYLTYSYEVSGEEQHGDILKDDSGAYTFEMPARNVYLDVAFVIDKEYDFIVSETTPKVTVKPGVEGISAADVADAQVTGIGGAVDANKVLEKSGLDETPEITLRAEITVTAADLEAKTVSFEVKPVAVVVDWSTASGIPVEISNDMLNGNSITVKLPIPDGIEPQEIVHISEDGTKEYYTLNGAKPFTIEPLSSGQRVAVLEVTHFRTFTMTGTAHKHDTELRNAKEATCTEDGYSGDKVCTVCGEITEKGQTIAKLPHTYDEGKITTEPSCQTEGVKTYSCTVCGATYTEKVAKTEHKKVEIPAVAATCTKDGATAGVKCSVCKEILQAPEKVPAKGHTWDKGKVTKEPTVTAEGVKTYTCTVCGATKNEAIEKLKACDGGKSCPAYGYRDVDKQQWYHLQVDYVIESKLMVGDGKGNFQPNANLTRAQMAQIMYSWAGRPAVTGKSKFSDVNDGAWYANAVIWATQNGVVYGYGGGKFAPDDPVTREQLVAMLYRYAGAPAATGTLNEFADASKVSSYAVDAMRWAVQEGIVHGDGGTTRKLRPNDYASRAEVATILYQYIG